MVRFECHIISGFEVFRDSFLLSRLVVHELVFICGYASNFGDGIFCLAIRTMKRTNFDMLQDTVYIITHIIIKFNWNFIDIEEFA